MRATSDQSSAIERNNTPIVQELSLKILIVIRFDTYLMLEFRSVYLLIENSESSSVVSCVFEKLVQVAHGVQGMSPI